MNREYKVGKPPMCEDCSDECQQFDKDGVYVALKLHELEKRVQELEETKTLFRMLIENLTE